MIILHIVTITCLYCLCLAANNVCAVLFIGSTWWLRLHGSESLCSFNLRRRCIGKPEHRAVDESAWLICHWAHTYPCQESGQCNMWTRQSCIHCSILTLLVGWQIILRVNTHTHLFNGPFPGLPRWAGTRKVKPIWILLKQETVSGNGIS